ncbi:MAG: palindromic element RPE1 domain-containing protein, partial [Rickettsia endosymbiont of Labidopullus appendiculatus]|nr:palindromic element RPE1 domain-containing protein [Rickettsia endosymbiont of Labidopullus appendiculatus]
KLAYAEEFEGDAERRTAAYSNVREDSSTASTYKLPAEVEFRRRSNQETVDIVIFATGSELSIALEVKDILSKNGFSTNVISMLCFELFFKQQASYIQNILSNAKLKVAIEAASSFGWHRIIGENGMFFGMEQFGLSAPSNDLYSYFGLTPSNISEKIMARIQKN